MDFFTQLNEEEVLELVNACITHDNEVSKWPALSQEMASSVFIYAETDRVDTNGQRYAWVRAVNQRRGTDAILSSYRVTDFNMLLGEGFPHEYNNILRAFMTAHFGREYIEALYNHHLKQAQVEATNLTEYYESLGQKSDR